MNTQKVILGIGNVRRVLAVLSGRMPAESLPPDLIAQAAILLFQNEPLLSDDVAASMLNSGVVSPDTRAATEKLAGFDRSVFQAMQSLDISHKLEHLQQFCGNLSQALFDKPSDRDGCINREIRTSELFSKIPGLTRGDLDFLFHFDPNKIQTLLSCGQRLFLSLSNDLFQNLIVNNANDFYNLVTRSANSLRERYDIGDEAFFHLMNLADKIAGLR